MDSYFHDLLSQLNVPLLICLGSSGQFYKLWNVVPALLVMLLKCLFDVPEKKESSNTLSVLSLSKNNPTIYESLKNNRTESPFLDPNLKSISHHRMLFCPNLTPVGYGKTVQSECVLLLMESLVALKRADWFGKMVRTQFTWSWCTWSQPWFPQRRRAWPAHRAGGA